jgi:hypothetical protein
VAPAVVAARAVANPSFPLELLADADGDVLHASGQTRARCAAWQRYLTLADEMSIAEDAAAQTGVIAEAAADGVGKKLAALDRQDHQARRSARSAQGP